MSRKRSIKLRCPICQKPTKASDTDFPFCSDRCRVIDLGKWASGAYVVTTPIREEDELDGASHPKPTDHEES